MSAENKYVLIAITNPAFVVSQINWANAIAEKTSWTPVVYWTLSSDRIDSILRDKNLKQPSLFFRRGKRNPLLLSILSRTTSLLEKIPFTSFLRLLSLTAVEAISSKVIMRDVRLLIHKYRICAMLLPDSSPAYFAPELIRAARKENVYTITNPLDRDCPESYAMIYKSDQSLYPKGISGWIIKKYFYKWCIQYEEKNILRLLPAKIFSQELLGIAPLKPWNTFGFMEDMIAVNNTIQQIFFLNTGVESEQIRVTGSPQLDHLAALKNNVSHIKKTLELFAFPEQKEILLCALPQTHWVAGRPEAEFQNHADMINAWLQCITAQSRFNVIISLHPSMRYEDFSYLNSGSLKVSNIDIMEILPLASVYVANVSSTIPLAIALGIPVINYDVYRYSTEMNFLRFEESGGTVTVLNRKEFANEIQKIVTDSDYFNTLKRKQAENSTQWGELDGNSIARFTTIIDKLPKL